MEKVTDNFKDFPGRMSDGRAFTNYGPNCLFNRTIAKENDSYDYRQFLINNAGNIVKDEYETLFKNYSCETCKKAIVPTEMFVQSCKGGYCMIDKVSNDGIGMRQQN